MATKRPQAVRHWPTPALLAALLVSLLSAPRPVTAKYGQFAPPDAYENGSSLAYYGSENPWNRRMFDQRSADRFTKRQGQRQLLAILEGQPEQAVAWCRQRLDKNRADGEALFTLTIAYCQMGQPQQARTTMQKALATGLPLARYLAGPRELLRPLTESDAFQRYLADHPVDLLHGPMLGNVTDRSAQFWVRTREAASVTIRVHKPGQEKVTASGTCQTSPLSDYTGIVAVEGLEPRAGYTYDVLIANRPAAAATPHTFRTYPPNGQPGDFRIAFGGGAGFTPRHESIWDRIASFRPDALLLLGDNVYIDLPEAPGPFHRYTYYRRQSRPEFRRLVDRTSVYAIWDDHDAGIDDIWMGPYLDRPAWKRPQWDLFRQNWVNPAYGDPKQLGCWFHFSIADVDFFLLDCRFYRTNPFGDHPSMLGPVQKAWLFDQLNRSQATFKVIVSSVPWA
ncbi:MAG: alkaline phosphatase D family protein, partial [Pirellulales bacterium]